MGFGGRAAPDGESGSCGEDAQQNETGCRGGHEHAGDDPGVLSGTTLHRETSERTERPRNHARVRDYSQPRPQVHMPVSVPAFVISIRLPLSRYSQIANRCPPKV